jgi:TrpR family trp operon transcriptional repressor
MDQKIWAKFLKITAKKNPEILKLWFDVLLTPAEKSDIADRILILEGLLKEKLSQRDLANDLQVSISKITRGSNALRLMSDSELKLLQDLLL